ncbi:hypothetical protein ACWCWQ_37190 [Streptomyces sp. NPDC001571]
MHTGSAESYREMENRSREIAEQIAALLNEAETIASSSTGASGGSIRLLGAHVRKGLDGWEVEA